MPMDLGSNPKLWTRTPTLRSRQEWLDMIFASTDIVLFLGKLSGRNYKTCKHRQRIQSTLPRIPTINAIYTATTPHANDAMEIDGKCSFSNAFESDGDMRISGDVTDTSCHAMVIENVAGWTMVPASDDNRIACHDATDSKMIINITHCRRKSCMLFSKYAAVAQKCRIEKYASLEI